MTDNYLIGVFTNTGVLFLENIETCSTLIKIDIIAFYLSILDNIKRYFYKAELIDKALVKESAQCLEELLRH